MHKHAARGGGRSSRRLLGLVAVAVGAACLATGVVSAGDERSRPHLQRAKVHLAAGDYRRAIEACQKEVNEAPSAESYVYLTYAYLALDGYVETMAQQERWVAIEQAYLNLATRGTEDLVDPPDVLARIAKEIIQGAAQKQADVTAAMAKRLDLATAERLWREQTEWRKARPDTWWSGVPDVWGW